ncbi:MAG: right-handed parallel beta-helix repeat-containing protein [Bacteroidales bacterium]|nr:right-handed parallel beta-helix repeat-containing protein [Bacteroidales bacterium]
MNRKTYCISSVFLLTCLCAGAIEYHVSPAGSDAAAGDACAPLKTIDAAAQKAMPGDTVTVHSGIYREWVNPFFGGIDDSRRILYRAAEGEVVEIKGSEPVSNWKKGKDGVWTAVIPNGRFGNYNPFTQLIEGDWFDNHGWNHHTAEVYLNELSLYEVTCYEQVARPEPIKSRRDPDGSVLVWYAEVDADNTTVYANFGDADPRKENVEVTFRPTCFYPTREGINYITVRGFRISQAATQWGAPTAEQIGMVGVHWAKGWIIEDNVIFNSRCNGISIGKQASTGHNLWNQRHFDGATEYIECTLNAIRKGWNKDNVGSHIIRNNEIYYCEQTGICGSMGGSFAEIYGNHIHDVWVKCQFNGAEISGIKLHAAIDAYIHNNLINNCQKGIWMDWMAQGSRISGNLFYDNVYMDLFYEVDHGPYVCDNNIMLSECALWDWSESGAYLHNIIGGSINARGDDRYTPYHLAHTTGIKGLYRITASDNRFINNIFFIGDKEDCVYGLDAYADAEWPIMVEGNMTCEKPDVEIEVKEDGVRLSIKGFEAAEVDAFLDGNRLGHAKLSDWAYENADGTTVCMDRDYTGAQRHPVTFAGPFDSAVVSGMKVW